jgi:hypothetical protein
MVVRISKNLEMKSLLPAPRSYTSFSPLAMDLGIFVHTYAGDVVVGFSLV